MKRAVVSGYATLDYVVQLEDEFHGTGTVMGAIGPSGAWPRAGGAVLYTSKRLAAAGHDCSALTWIGDDADGSFYLEACRSAGIRHDAITQSTRTQTPRCILIYNTDGSYGCLLDSGGAGNETLSSAQSAALAAAELVCIAVGPANATEAIIDQCSDSALVAWIAKVDNLAFPMSLRRKIADRANYIFCNGSERNFVSESFMAPRREDQTIIETLGSAGVLIDTPSDKRVLSTEFVKTNNTTGAGDTLAGEVLARIVTGTCPAEDAVQLGMKAARELLLARQ